MKTDDVANLILNYSYINSRKPNVHIAFCPLRIVFDWAKASSMLIKSNYI